MADSPLFVSFDLRCNFLYTMKVKTFSGEVMNYQFSKDDISQQVVKYGVDIRPPISVIEERAKLQQYCDRLIGLFPQAFETLIAGPGQMQVQKTFVLNDGKKVGLPTFVLTARGPVFTFPVRMFIDEVRDIEIGDKDKMFRKALDGLRNTFIDRKVPRIGVINEIIFDTGELDSLQILASNLKNEIWRERLKNLTIRLQAPVGDKNINIEIRPTLARRLGKPAADVEAGMRFGLIVNVDINNRQLKEDMTTAEINDILAFAGDYIPDELIRFLNNEY